MKCFNCNNDIPDASIVCPFCGSKVEPMSSPTPVFNLESTSSLPVTPSVPVLPQDQAMNSNFVDNSLSSNNQNMNLSVSNVNQVSQGLNSGQVENKQIPESTVQGISEVQQTTNIAPTSPVNQNPEQASVTPPVQTSNTPILENAINSAVINPQGEIVSGEKIANSVPPVKNKNKNKKKLIIILIVLGVVLIIGGICFWYYHSQYQTADKRVSAVFRGITSMTQTLKNEGIDKASGTYQLDLNVDYNDEAIKAKLDGTYARDLSSGMLDITANVQSLVKGEELLNSPLNLEIYYNEAKVYVLLENFFDMYIYDEYKELDNYFDAIKQNNISYVNLISTLKRAINAGIVNMSSTQTVKNVTIHGGSVKANAVSIRFTARNQHLFVNAFCRVLANDTTFVSEIAKLTGKTEEAIKEQINGATQNDEYQDIDLMMEIYTEKFGEKFLGLKITTKENLINKIIQENENEEVKVLEVYPITNGYGISYKNGSQNIFEGTIEKTLKRTSTTNESNYKVDFTMYHGSVAYKIAATLNLVGDVNPKDAKVNVKNSINKIYLTAEHKASILEKYNHSGTIALHYPDLFNNFLGIDSFQNTLIPECASQSTCMNVSNCQASNYEGYSLCKNPENIDVICHNDWLTPEN